MKEFDFVRAWSELAYPAFLSLPQNVRDLFWETHIKAQNIVQDKKLDLPWPEEYGFKNKFMEIPAEELAKASKIIYCFGHWGFSICSRSGSYWKFSMYADRVLRKKLWGEETCDHDILNGWGLQVYEGFLRACLSTPEYWTSKEIGLATSESYINASKLLSKINVNSLKNKKLSNDEIELFENTVSELKEKNMPKGIVARLNDLTSFMTESNLIKNRNWY